MNTRFVPVSVSVFIIAILALLLPFILPLTALAHSTVAPSKTTESTYETFTLSVPSEKEFSTTGIRIIIPEGLDRITPIIKSGWELSITRGENEEVIELEWTGGFIPPHQKDIFQFTARTPAEATTLAWKAYQTYSDGSIVAWDRDPTEASEDENLNPYSVTEVVESATFASGNAQRASTGDASGDYTQTLAFVAVIISVIALGISLRKA